MLYDFIIDCPVLPSTTFITPVSAGFQTALGAALAANGTDTTAVTAVSNALTAVGAFEYIKSTGPDAAITTELNGLETGVETTVETIAAAGTQITNATVVAALLPVNALCKFYHNCLLHMILTNDSILDGAVSTVYTLSTGASTASLFSPQPYCPVGQGKDFIAKYRAITPENPATTNAAYGVDVGIFAFFVIITVRE